MLLMEREGGEGGGGGLKTVSLQSGHVYVFVPTVGRVLSTEPNIVSECMMRSEV